jgi:leader peptidase (prepilin peptidase)/N-methyltransferase
VQVYVPTPLNPRTQIAGAFATSVIFAWAWLAAPWAPILVTSLVLGWSLECLAAIDLMTFRLPDAFTLPLILAGLGVAILLPGRPLADHVIGALVGWGLLALLAWTYRRVRGRDGLGAGDAKLLAAAGAWLGWAALPSVILIACAATFVWVGVGALARGPDALSARMAFGAPLCLAIWIVWLCGPLAV